MRSASQYGLALSRSDLAMLSCREVSVAGARLRGSSLSVEKRLRSPRSGREMSVLRPEWDVALIPEPTDQHLFYCEGLGLRFSKMVAT